MTTRPVQRPHARVIGGGLIGVAAFNLVSALVGAVALVTVGLPIPLTSIRPFPGFFWPGMLLGGVVGGTQVVALLAQVRHWRRWPFWAAFAGYGMVVWSVVEVAIMQSFVVLHAIYLAAGLLQIGLVLLRLGLLEARDAPEDRTGASMG